MERASQKDIEGTVSDYVDYGDTPNQWIAHLQYTYERQDN